jgi:hypothetical protein
MTDTAKMINELRAKIAANRKQLEEQERALVVLEQMMAQPLYSEVFQDATAKSGPPSNLALPTPMVVASKKTQKEIVCEAIDALNGQEFTVATIANILERTGKQFEGQNPRNRISVVLGSLEDNKVIRKTFTGGGNVPHRYKAIPAEARGLI